MAGAEPNAENKLFVGGCPPGSGEEDLRKIFEEHGDVEEIFIMRGGSRSGMACAFVRYLTQEMAQKAIDTIHGQITLPNAAEPLVVRWADAPGSRRRESRGERSHGKSRGSGGGGRDSNGVPVGRPVFDYQQQQQQAGWVNGAYSSYMYPQMMGGGYNQGYYGQGQMGGTQYYGQGGYSPQQMQMMAMPYQQQGMQRMQMPYMQMGPPMNPYAMGELAAHMPAMSPTEHAH